MRDDNPTLEQAVANLMLLYREALRDNARRWYRKGGTPTVTELNSHVLKYAEDAVEKRPHDCAVRGCGNF